MLNQLRRTLPMFASVAVAITFLFLPAIDKTVASEESLASNAFPSATRTRPRVRRVVFELDDATAEEARALYKTIVASSQGRLEQRFVRVNDALELRAGGKSGALITWSDRGFGGRYTWSYRDPAPEVRDITGWASGNVVRLWARIVQLPNGTGSRFCIMDTLSGGSRRQHWEFDGEVEFSINR